MPPRGNYSYRVYFNYVAEHTGEDFWKAEGKYWSKDFNAFATPNAELRAATQQITAGANTQEARLRAIYATVMTFENTDFTRSRQKREDAAAGLGKVNNAMGVFERKRGNSTQLAGLFIAMARAAAINADAMIVPDRSREIFLPQWLDMDQFDDIIAVAEVDGKETFFDPGQRYCPYGRLAWQHTLVHGLRQRNGEVIFGETPAEDYASNLTTRVANLKLDADGEITGRIDLGFTGAEALRWRQASLRSDQPALEADLRAAVDAMLPRPLQTTDITLSNLDDYEQPLKVSFTVKGQTGAWKEKRVILPADLFVAGHPATFPEEKREIGVDFHYPQYVKDAVRIVFPADFTVEATPQQARFQIALGGAYTMTVDPSPKYFSTRREYAFNEVLVPATRYQNLRSFYSQIEANDQQSVVLKSTSAPTTTPGGN